MNFLKTLKWVCCCILFQQSLSAAHVDDQNSLLKMCCHDHSDHPCDNHAHFGTASFSVTDPGLWYTIETNSYPETVPLSQDRNKGVAEGRVYLSPTGFTIGETGNYWVSITAVLQNPTEDSTILIPVFLALDDVYDPDSPSPIGGIATLSTDAIQTVHGVGTLKDIAEGTRLSLVATNAGYPLPVPVKVVSWSISLFKIP